MSVVNAVDKMIKVSLKISTITSRKEDLNGNIQKIMGQGIRIGKCIAGLLYQVRKCGGFHLMHMLNTVERIGRNKMLEVLFWGWEIYLRG